VVNNLQKNIRKYKKVDLLASQPMYPGGLLRQPCAIVDYIPQSGIKNLATGLCETERVIFTLLQVNFRHLAADKEN
jgi:hypothetical protein